MSADNLHLGNTNRTLVDAPVQIERLTRQNKQLKQDNELLQARIEQLQKEQTAYLQNVSHQLVAPLHAMKMHVENLRAGKIQTPDRVLKVLRSVYSQATISVHLAKNFALMSNLESDQTLSAQREPLEPIDLKRLMINLADDFQPSGWEKNLQIAVIDVPLDSAPAVLAIKNLVSQAFSNIIENAIKYSDDDSEINIFGNYSPGNDSVTVSISNRGIPLIDSEKNRLFTRGYRSKDAKNAYPAGTGFGLYIAKRIIDIHEGTITAGSDGKGLTVFRVTLSVKALQGKMVQREAKDRANSRR